MRRRLFLQALFGLPALTLFRPRHARSQPSDGPTWSDSLSTADLTALHDEDLITGIEYQP